MVRQSAKDAAFGAKLFYNFVMYSVVAIFLVYDNDLQRAIFNFNLPYIFGFFGLWGLAYYFYNICGSNPGFIPVNKELEEINTETSEKSPAKTLLGNHTPPPDTTIVIDIENVDVLEEKNEPAAEVKIPERSVKPRDNENGQRFCDECHILQPFRSKHCKDCERCVYKFDHHCFWVGGCVGELNHRKFWLFLFFQTILETWAYFIADSGLESGYSKGEALVKAGTKGVTSPYATSEYGAFMVAYSAVILAWLFTGILWAFHTFLLLTNQSTWEFSKKDKLSYLKQYPRSFYPFSGGYIENIKSFFFHGNQPTVWELPPVPSHRKRGFNWCENEYYSCC